MTVSSVPSSTSWIWQQPQWPGFHWQAEAVAPALRRATLRQGELLGLSHRGDDTQPAQALETLLTNIVHSSAIEGERLNVQSLRSSLARRLGLSDASAYPVSRRSEGLAELMLEAVTALEIPLTLDTLLRWHALLFPEPGLLQSVAVGQLRRDDDGPMQVVSGRIDRPRVHFEAPPANRLEAELARFVEWFNASLDDNALDPLIRAGLCHLYLITLHPFEDGNGRLTRALTDRVLAQAEAQSIRLYAMSEAIMTRRSDYYAMLESTQHGGLDITAWLVWFLETLEAAMREAITKVERTFERQRFWQRHAMTALSDAQTRVLERLLEGGDRGFETGISASQYQKVAKVSKATATRHLQDLVEKGCLEPMSGGGRSTRYRINGGKRSE
ncbi:Fic family protein [Salinicola endophyticus]|uniref:Fic family protein n=1 Tax=Salinicola endophyticus TaxID=1949083 RepID=A0ABY8FE92_9GAMM|nr:Fic family protein [Salinicola endophyticus]WFF41143.1 Fic family protein [Salinicola endophyticus]